MGIDLIDMTEKFAMQMDLNFCRMNDNEISLQLCDSIPGYNITAVLKQEEDILCFLCDTNLVVSARRYRPLVEAVAQANEHTLCGYFNIRSSDQHIMYNFTIPLVSSLSADDNTIESIVQLTVNECDKFYQYFLAFTTAKCGKGNTANPLLLNTVLLDTIGEA